RASGVLRAWCGPRSRHRPRSRDPKDTGPRRLARHPRNPLVTGATASHRLTVYSRQGCHLCDVMIDAVRAACAGRASSLEIVDVDSSAELASRYGAKVPVLLVDGREICHFHLDEDVLVRALG